MSNLETLYFVQQNQINEMENLFFVYRPFINDSSKNENLGKLIKMENDEFVFDNGRISAKISIDDAKYIFVKTAKGGKKTPCAFI
jgi:hypothetical protein